MTRMTLDQALQLARSHQQAGRLGDAESIYKDILAAAPDNAEVHADLAVVLHRSGQIDRAIAEYRHALALAPDYFDAHNNMGLALQAKGQLDPAIASFERALALHPNSPQVHNNLGAAWRAKGQLDRAIEFYAQAIALRPDYADAHCNRGDAYYQKGEIDQAVACYLQALALNPDHAEASYNLANAMKDVGRLDDAIARYQKAISIKPGLVDAHNNLGAALAARGDVDAAIACYQRALALDPNHSGSHNNLGNLWTSRDQPDLAVECLRRALALHPGDSAALSNLGNAWKCAGQLDAAIACFRRALSLDAHCIAAHDNLLTTMHYHPDTTDQMVCAEARLWNRQFAEPLRHHIRPHSNTRDASRRLRVGYMSSDFQGHASALFLLPLFRHHDRQQFDLFVYAQVPRPDAISKQLQEHASQWNGTVGLSDPQVAQQIRRDRIDILVDLKLHTADNRLMVFAHKPAPVQVTWLGYPGTTGMDAIDYRLTDPFLDPPGTDESIYSECSIRLPDTFWCYDPLATGPDVGALPCTQNGHITFGSLNNFCKVNDGVLAIWSKVLAAVPGSRLILMTPPGNSRQRVIERFAGESIASDRIEFVARQPRAMYLRTYHLIDIALDTFPYNGHTTGLDALWMGVPVVTLLGKTIVGRAGLSQLSNLKLPELVAQSPGQYVQIASDLAGDQNRLANLRRVLRQRMELSPLMDAALFARNVESAYRMMWHTWCAQLGGS